MEDFIIGLCSVLGIVFDLALIGLVVAITVYLISKIKRGNSVKDTAEEAVEGLKRKFFRR